MNVVMPNLQAGAATEREKRIRKVLAGQHPLWVVNTSNEVHEGGQRSIQFINFVESNGEHKNVALPDSYLPINLTAQVSRKAIRASRDFWTFVNAGMLKAIPDDRARALLSTDDAQEELLRLETRRRGARRAEELRKQMMGANGKIPSSGQTRFDREHPEDRGKEKEEEPVSTVSPRVQSICGRISAGQMKPRLAIAEFKSMTLTQDDLGYIIGFSRYQDSDTGAFDDTVADWASETITSRAIKEGIRRRKERAERAKAEETARTSRPVSKAPPAPKPVRSMPVPRIR